MKKTLLSLFMLLVLGAPLYLSAQTVFNGKVYYPFPEETATPSAQTDTPEQLIQYSAADKSVKNVENSVVTEEMRSMLSNKERLAEIANTSKLFSNPAEADLAQYGLAGDPVSATVKMFVSFPSGNNYVCTGAMYFFQYVITAGRCVYLESEGGFATEIIAVPGYYDGIPYYGASTMLNALAFNGWTQNADPGWDVGFVILNSPVGLYTGAFTEASGAGNYTSANFTAHGYPDELSFDGERVHTRTGNFDNDDGANLVTFNNRKYRSEEGTVFYNDEGAIEAVLSEGTTSGFPLTTSCAKMDEDRGNAFLGALIQSLPPEPDLSPHLAGINQAEAVVVPAGGQTNEFFFGAFNSNNLDAPAFNNTLEFSVFLTDDYLTFNEVFLVASASVDIEIATLDVEFITLESLTIPEDVPPGDYFLGVLITNEDFNPTNNVTNGFFHHQPITITEAQVETVLNVDPASIDVPATEGTTTANVEANVEWTPTTEADWLSFGTQTDGSIEILYAENTATTGRSAEVTITGGEEMRTIIINQAAAEASIAVAPQRLDYEAAGGNLSLTINSNVDWAVSTTANWLSFSANVGDGTQTIEVTATENPTTEERVSAITITGMGVTATVQVNQQGQAVFLMGSPATLNYDANGGAQNANISSNTSYSISTAADWLTLSDEAGTGDLQLGVTATANPTTESRTAVINLTGDGVTNTIQVNQQGANPMLVASPTALDYMAAGGAQEVNVAANISYTASTEADWLTITPTTGNGNGTISVAASENTSIEGRTATVTVTGEDGSTQTITVTQAGAAVMFSVAPEQLNYAATGGDLDLNLTGNVSFTLATEADWLTIGTTTGNGNQTIVVTATENAGVEGRSATIIITLEDGTTRTVNVTQSGATVVFNVSPTNLDYPAAGDTRRVEVTANITYTVSTEADWLTINEDATGFDVIAAENTVVQSRTATITVTGEDGSVRMVTVTQAGVAAFVTASPDQLDYEAAGGEQSTMVNANVDYTISTQADWLTLSTTSGSGMLTLAVTAAENGTTTARSATIIVAGEMGVQQTIQVNQAAAVAFLTAMPNNLAYEAAGGSQDAMIDANISYTISTTADWLTLSSTGGEGAQTLSVTAAENTSTATRSATIEVSGQGLNQTIQVTQNGTAPVLVVAPEQLSYEAAGGSQDAMINANISYTISTAADWLTLSSTGGEGNQVVAVTAAENTSTMSRSATIEISGEGLDRTIQVTQNGTAPVLAVAPDQLDYVAAGGSQDATISANISYTISTAADWLTLSSMGGEGNQVVTVTAAENTATMSRSATIEISGEGLNQTIQVTQAAAAVILTAAPTNLDVAAAGGSEEVTLQANVDWTVENNNDWFTVSPTSGTGEVTIGVEVMENTSTEARMGTFTIMGGGSTTTVTVNQAGAAAVLTVSPTNLQYEFGGGTQSVMVNSNIDWTAMASDDWFTVAMTEGSGNAAFTVTADANEAAEPRSGMITFTGGGITVEVQVSQAGMGAMLSVNPQSLQLGVEESCVDLNIQSNVSWAISTEAEWITSITPAEGNGSMTVTVCYATNESADARTTTLNIVSEDAGTVTVDVTQAGISLFVNVNPQAIQVPATPGVASFEISSNANWTINEEATWFSVNPESGEGNAMVEVNYDQNFITEGRQDMITVNIDGQEATVMIIQAGAVAFVNVDETDFNVADTEGCIEVSVFANTEWAISTDNEWITSIEPAMGIGDQVVTICYNANTEEMDRTAQLTLTAEDVSPIDITINQAGMTVGLEDVNGDLIAITTYPNPATEIVNWQFSQPLANDVRLEIVTVNGQLITRENNALTRDTQTYQLDVRNYAAGIYFFRLVSEEGAASGRFMVAK